MINKISNIIAISLFKSGIITSEDIQIYQYGTELLILKNLHITTMIFIGFIMKLPIETMVFMTVYTIMRKYSGGYHSRNNKNCLLISCITIILSGFLTTLIYQILDSKVTIVLALITIISMAIIIVLSPIDNNNKPLDETEIYRYGLRSKIWSLLFLVAYLLLMILGVKYYISIAAALFTQCVMLFAGIQNSPRLKVNRRTKEGET